MLILNSPCSTGWPQTHGIPPVSGVLGIQAYTTTPGSSEALLRREGRGVRVSLCSAGWLWTCINLPASTSQVLGYSMCHHARPPLQLLTLLPSKEKWVDLLSHPSIANLITGPETMEPMNSTLQSQNWAKRKLFSSFKLSLSGMHLVKVTKLTNTII